MKSLFSCLIFLLLIMGCATVPTTLTSPQCPPEDVIVMHPGYPEYGIPPMPMKIGEGSMIPENYWTIEEWDEAVREGGQPKQSL